MAWCYLTEFTVARQSEQIMPIHGFRMYAVSVVIGFGGSSSGMSWDDKVFDGHQTR